jgi:hypothetical protein
VEPAVRSVDDVLPAQHVQDIAADLPATAAELVAIDPARVGAVLACIAFVLVLLSLVTGATGWADQIFALDAERNVPTYFSTILLFIASALLALIATQKRRSGDRFRRHWAGLSLIFLYLSMDEMIGFHEMTSSRIERVVHTSGMFYFASTVFTSALVLLVAVAYLRFLLKLPRRMAMLFFVSAVLYVGGGLGMEMVGALLDQSLGTSSVYYALSTTVEETLEMCGAILFIYSLLTYLSVHLRETRVQIAGAA